MIGWYVIHSKTAKENFVRTQCCQRNIETYLPLMKVVSSRRTKKIPYFPGYLFIHVDLETTGRSTFDWMPGAIGFVSFGGEPARIPNKTMEVLRGRIESDNQTALDEDAFHPGDTVIIHEGPFKNYEAIFERRLDHRQRVRVLLKFFQDRSTQLELSANDISLKKS
ncbi:MAG: hypothetical protein JW750_02410 [Anaerolineaceae bacterium]|nr:hypothetical protein [Anaerolineaceae bacterium]